eukprot:TRINITY_DN72474_c0_g1_i1.p2 TRINITY_DN72474_c0_g1~~TRINITY_DN72474_c0_g1_i1.p2  ORF type:complete len:425 (+),score=129.29 TRINITY_DN72474_c0_g1_i1:74-1276(+)
MAAMALRPVASIALLAGNALGLAFQKPVDTSQYGQHEFVASHASTLHGMSQDEQQQTFSNLQRFVASQDNFASLVLFGDSTMAGVVTEILNISQEVQDTMELIYVSNDRLKRVRYGCDEACGGVPPGGEWNNESAMTDVFSKAVLKRAEASTAALHASDCKSGGGLETYIFRAGPYKNLVVHHWGFLPEYSGFCWQPCMDEAMAALKPTAVVWNVGFHLLNHDFTPSICNQRHNPVKPGCGNYKEMVKMGTTGMLEAGVKQVIWKHTNWVCEKRQIAGFPKTAKGLRKWHKKGALMKLERACASDCPQYKEAGLKCYDWFFDAHASARMYRQALLALREVRAERPDDADSILELDAFKASKDCCAAGCEAQTDDGEHYAGLDAGLAVQLADMLGKLSGKV